MEHSRSRPTKPEEQPPLSYDEVQEKKEQALASAKFLREQEPQLFESVESARVGRHPMMISFQSYARDSHVSIILALLRWAQAQQVIVMFLPGTREDTVDAASGKAVEN